MVLARASVLGRFSHIQLFVMLWTVAHHDPLEWLSFPLAGELPDSGIKPISLVSSALADRVFTTSTTWEALVVLVPTPCASVC